MAITNAGPAEFHATLDPVSKSLTFQRLSTLRILSVDGIPDPSGVSGMPAPGDVDLTSPGACTTSGSGAATVVSCPVEMIWGATDRSLPNPVVQIAGAVGEDGGQTSYYDAANGDGNNPLGIPKDHGVWVFTNSSEPDPTNPLAGGGPYFLAASGTGFNTGNRTWELKALDSSPVTYDVLVWASLSYASYQFSFGCAAYVDACTGGTTVTASKGSVTAPFDFVVYDNLYQLTATNTGAVVNFARNGQVTWGSTALAASGTALDLPSTLAPRPSFWPFWDDLVYGAGGKICYQVTGSAPNRQLAIEWRGVTFGDSPDEGAALDFEAFLNEGTGQIDTVYQSMVADPGDTSGREQGSEAWVGIQDPTGTIATGEFHVEDYGTGSAYSYVPVP